MKRQTTDCGEIFMKHTSIQNVINRKFLKLNKNKSTLKIDKHFEQAFYQ